MLTSVAIAKSIAIPIVLAVLLVVCYRPWAATWRSLVAFLLGGWGAFSLNSAILRSLPSFLPPDQLQANTPGQAFLCAFGEAAIPEEFAKGIWLLLLMFVWRNHVSRQGAWIGGLIGLGFALRENLAYAQTAEDWRAFATLSHGAWGVITGHLLQSAIDTAPRRLWKCVGAFVPSILLHGLMNAAIFLVEVYEPTVFGTLPETDPSDVISPVSLMAMLGTWMVAIFSWIWAIRIIRRPAEKDVTAIPRSREGDSQASSQ